MHSRVSVLFISLVFREHNVADKAETLAGSVASSHVAAETVVMATERNHLSVSGRAVDSLPTPTRGRLFVSYIFLTSTFL